MKPKILITTRIDLNNGKSKAQIYTSYIDAIYAANGLPFLAPHRIDNDIDEIISMFDGLLVTGGEDIDSVFYDQKPSPLTIPAPKPVDETDLLLIKAFKSANKPILGICRGIQVINVAFGGNLIQDIHEKHEHIDNTYHQQNLLEPSLANNKSKHPISIVKDTQLYHIYDDRYQVNSFHHQAIDKVASGFKVSAYSDDDIIEAIEDNDKIIAVQWHPERMIDDEKHLALFNYFIDKCKTSNK